MQRPRHAAAGALLVALALPLAACGFGDDEGGAAAT
jgi:hypothetical protein